MFKLIFFSLTICNNKCKCTKNVSRDVFMERHNQEKNNKYFLKVVEGKIILLNGFVFCKVLLFQNEREIQIVGKKFLNSEKKCYYYFGMKGAIYRGQQDFNSKKVEK